MSGFDPAWLALREPADHGAINAEVRRALTTRLRARGNGGLRIVDLGCGSGSNLRGLAPWLAGSAQHWVLVDYDPALLAHAQTHPLPDVLGLTFETREADLNSADLDALFAGADLVTAAAFFDLASRATVDAIAAATVRAGAIFATVLSYDGVAAFLPPTPTDGDMLRLFNTHQRTDKGLGAALGPDATDALEHAFQSAGYRTQRGDSPWVLRDPDQADLRLALERGWAAAVAETGQLPADTISAWLDARASVGDAVTIVGHEDLIAYPSA